jgi:methionyl aminopeptidase
MVILKSGDEIELIRQAGKIVALTLAAVRAAIRPGVTLLELDRLGEQVIRDHGAVPSFLGYKPHFADTPFPATLCLSVNDAIVHGIPDGYRLREGDVLSVDCGAVVGGYHADAATTTGVGAIDPVAVRLLATTERALAAGIEQARPGNRLGDISHAIGQVARADGFGIVPDFGGHGVGQRLHEDPQVLNDGQAGRGLRLREGLVLALEPMFTAGAGEYVLRPDGWTLATADRSLAAHFEHTIAVTAEGPEPLTVE